MHGVRGIDHIEFAVANIENRGALFERMGFERLGIREGSDGISALYQQGGARIVVTQPSSRDSHAAAFLAEHGDGVCTVGISTTDARMAFDEAGARGGRLVSAPERLERGGAITDVSEVSTPGNVRFRFVSRSPWSRGVPIVFDQRFVIERPTSPSPHGLVAIDHFTNNVSVGAAQSWIDYYVQVFGFRVHNVFSVDTGRSGLLSTVVESPNGRLKIPINEGRGAASQVQLFCDRFHGPGVQHIAFLTPKLLETIPSLRERGFAFLAIPPSYYETLRIPPELNEDVAELQRHAVLLDADQEGSLLQIFTEEVVGALLFEYIERRRHRGFGERNIKALYEAVEQDQLKREEAGRG